MTDLTMITDKALYRDSGVTGFGNAMYSGTGKLGNTFLNGLTAVTQELFIRASSPDSSFSIFTYKTNALTIAIQSDGVIRCDYRVTSSNLTMRTSMKLVDGEIYHIAFVAGPSGAKVFIDGVLEESFTTPFDSALLNDTHDFMVHGGYASTNTSDMWGLAFWDIEKYTTDFTPPTAPYNGDEDNLINLYNLDGNGIDSAGNDDLIIKPNDELLTFSPYNWDVSDVKAASICGGSYFKFQSDSDKITLHFEPSSRSPQPIVAVFRDGVQVSRSVITPDFDISPPVEGARGYNHLYEIVTDATASDNDRWGGQDTAIKLLAISISSGTSISKVDALPSTVLIYGDSITEGVDTVHPSIESSSISNNSSVGCYPLQVGLRNNAEVGVVGFGSLGFTVGGRGGVPKFPDSYQYIMEGVPRDFAPEPDLCVWMMGTNDVEEDTVPDGLITLNGLLSVTTNTKFLILRPFLNSRQEDNLIAMVQGCDDPSRVVFGDTDGFETSGRLHPYAYEHLTSISTGVANLIAENMVTGYTGETSSATIAIDGMPNGAYRTVITSDDSRLVFDAELTYSSGSAVANGIQAPAGSNLLGAIIDNANPHVSGAVVSVVSE